MKLTSFAALLILLYLLLVGPVKAQDSHTTDTGRKWYLPDHAVVQFAGNIGLLAVGPGYSYLGDKVNTELLYGLTPGFEANTSIHIFTLKNAYHPFTVTLSETYLLDPLKVGIGISYSVGPQFYTSLPKTYPDKYYWWSSSLRLTPFIGSALSRKIGHDKTNIKRLEVYYELGTNDLDIVSKLDNRSLSLWDITNLAFGTKLVF